jgi:hypothetical protein
MCVKPTILKDGTEVGCRQCWQCREQKVRSLVGRCIAESKYSEEVTTMTLTYEQRNDDIRGAKAVTIVYADVQQFLKNLRKKWKVRFICASEYGSKKGRAHHHIVIFWGKRPDAPHLGTPWKPKGYYYPDWEYEYAKFKQEWLKKNKYVPKVYSTKSCFHWPVWSHGHVHMESGIAHEKFAYAMKYTFKDMDQRSTKNELRMSLKPILGWEYFEALAQEYVDQGIKPKHWNYWFREFKDKYGNIRKYSMTRTLRKRFKETVQKKWQQKWGHELQCELFDYNSNDIELTKQHAWPHLGHPDPKRPVSHGAWGINIPDEIKDMWKIDDKKAKYAFEWKFDEVQVTRAKYQGIDIEIATDKNGTTVTYNSKEGKQEWHDVPDAVKEKLIEKSVVEERRRYQQRAEA